MNYTIVRTPENPDELMHYGVKGMKWGVRRGLSELRESKVSGSKGSHNHAVATLSTHRDKINKKLTQLDAKSDRLEKKRYKVATKDDVKIAKYNNKSAKLRRKAGVTYDWDRERRLTKKANRLDVKVAKLEKNRAKVQAKIEKNERLKKAFNMGLKDINDELVKNGQDFLYMKSNGLPYTLADIEV